MAAPGPRRTLQRSLGPLDAASLVISNTIGVGIFTTPALVSCLVPHPGLRIGVWIGGGVLAWIGAMAYAELAARRPRAGGEYVYIREAFGPLGGFLTGWTSFVAGFSGAIAAAAIAAATLLIGLLSDAGFRTDEMRVSLVAVLLIAAAAGLHILGLGAGRRVQNSLTVVKIVCLLLVASAGFAAVPMPPSLSAIAPESAGWGWLVALIPVMFSYSGWNAASYIAEEIREPRRNLPRALLLGTAVVAAIYLAVNLAYAHVFTSADLCRASNPAVQIAGRSWGTASGRLISAMSVVVLLSSISAMTMAGPRVYFSMARDGVFPAAAAQVHARFRTPAVAIVAQALWTVALVLTGTFNQLLAYTGFAVVMFGAIAVSCVFVMRRRREDAPFRMWGYPFAPVIFVATMGAILVAVVTASPWESAAGLAVIGSGVPLFRLLRRVRVWPCASGSRTPQPAGQWEAIVTSYEVGSASNPNSCPWSRGNATKRSESTCVCFTDLSGRIGERPSSPSA